MLLFIFDVVYLFPGYFAMLLVLHPSFSDLRRSPPALTLPLLLSIAFFFFYLERYGFKWAFCTRRHFLLYAPSRHFWHIPDILAQPAFIKVSLGAGHRPGPSVYLIHSNPQSSIHLSFVFSFTYGENFDKISNYYSAAMKI